MQKGDYIYDSKTGYTSIFKDYVEEDRFCAFAVMDIDSNVDIHPSYLIEATGTVNNPGIIEEMDKSLFRQGYHFDTEKLVLSNKRTIMDDYYVPELHTTNDNDYEKGIMCATEEEAKKLEEVALEAIRIYLTKKNN